MAHPPVSMPPGGRPSSTGPFPAVPAHRRRPACRPATGRPAVASGTAGRALDRPRRRGRAGGAARAEPRTLRPVLGSAAPQHQAAAAERLAPHDLRAVRADVQPGGEPHRHPPPPAHRAGQPAVAGLLQDRDAEPQGRRRQDDDDRHPRRHLRLPARRPRRRRGRQPGPRHAQPEDPAGDQRHRAQPPARLPARAPLHRRARVHVAGPVTAGGARERAGPGGVGGVQRGRLPPHGQPARALLQHRPHRLRHRPDALGDVRGAGCGRPARDRVVRLDRRRAQRVGHDGLARRARPRRPRAPTPWWSSTSCTAPAAAWTWIGCPSTSRRAAARWCASRSTRTSRRAPRSISTGWSRAPAWRCSTWRPHVADAFERVHAL